MPLVPFYLAKPDCSRGVNSLNATLLRALSAFLMWSSVLFPVSTVLWKVLGLNIAVYLSASQLLWDLVISVSPPLAQGLTVTGYGMKWDFPFAQ